MHAQAHAHHVSVLAQLESEFGFFIPEIRGLLPEAANDRIALDAQPSLVTVSNSGVPAYLANYMDPKFVKVLVTPMQAAKILGGLSGQGEAKKGDWVTETATFPVVENTGEVSSYGDYSENGSAGANLNFPQRQSYHYQIITQWGEKQLAQVALARLDWASQMNIASALVLMKAQNKSYFYGVAGLQNYGLLNDPALLPPIAPGPKAYNTGLVGPWITNGVITATGLEIFTDIQSLFAQLVGQTGGIVTMESPMTLAMSPASQVALTATTQFNVNVMDILTKNFPNLRVMTAVEYLNSTTGNIVQLIANELDGQEVAFCAFTEKMRAHPIIRAMSAFMQKKSQGTWGTVITQPVGISMMVGV